MGERQPVSNRIKIRHIPSAIFGKISGELLVATSDIEIIDPNNSMPEAQKSLETNSLVMAFGHTSGDYRPLARFMRKLVPDKHIGAVTAWQYLDKKRNRLKSIALHSWERGLGVTFIGTVQDYDKEHYGEAVATAINFRSTKQTLEFLNQQGNALGIAPTGTRNDVRLTPAVEAVGAILIRNPNTKILPTAIIPGSIRNGETTKIYVGKLLTLADLEAKCAQIFGDTQTEGKTKLELKHQHNKQIADTLMLEIAALLPEEYRGYYGELFNKLNDINIHL